MAAVNGLFRRRHRSTSLRDSPEEDGQVELQETARLRDRVQKRERDRELTNRNKQRRGDRYVQGSNRDEDEESSEESVDNDEDYEGEEGRVSRVLPSKQPSPSSSMSNHSNRRSFAPAKVVRSSPVWKPDELIGVPIPRKARSATAKKSHEYWLSGGGDVGFGDEQSHRRPLTSPVGQTIHSAPLSRKKIRPIGPKTRHPKASSKRPSSSSVVQDDVEIEVAEALYDLMKQPQSQSRSSKKRENKSGDGNKSGCSPPASTQTASQVSNLPQDFLASGSNRKIPEVVKDEDENGVVLTQNSSVPSVTKADSEEPTKMEIEISSPKMDNKASEEASIDLSTSQAMVAASLESQEAAVKQEEISEPPAQVSKCGDGVVAMEEVAAPKEKSPSCAELAFDPVDLTKTRALMVSEVETKQESKFDIDLMDPPPMASSPEKDGIIDLVAGPKIMAQDVEMKTETVVENEYKLDQAVKNEVVVELEDQKKETMCVKQEQLKLDQDKGGASVGIRLQLLDWKQQQQSKTTILEGEKSAQSSSLPLPIAVAGWPDKLPLGYMPPLQTITPISGTTGSSSAFQPPHFTLSQPRPKRCATHYHIARNINYHQQFTKMNHIWPAVAGAASVYGAKPYNVNVLPSAQNMIHDSPLLRGSFPDEKGRDLTSVSCLNGKDKSSEVSSITDATQKKQLVPQQAPQPVPAGNLLHGPAFLFPWNQHQTAMGTTAANEAGLPKSATSGSIGPLPGNLAMGAPVSSSSLPAITQAMSFNYPSLPANEAPYMAILQNNGFPFPISTHVGMPPPLKGGTHAQAMYFYNGSLYSSPVFHPSQDQQRCQPMVQSAHRFTSTSGGSLSSHKQPQSQQEQATQVTSNYFPTTSTQLQQRQKQHVLPSHSSKKHEAEMTGEYNPLIGDNRAQKGVYSQNFAVPVQPMSFALMPPVTLGSSNDGEKQQQQLGAKGGVELIPTQAFALYGYQIAQAVQQKNEGKPKGDSTNPDDGRKAILGKSPTSFGQSLSFSKPGCTDPSASVIVGNTVYDGSAGTFNFTSSSAPGNRPCSISTTMTTASVKENPPNSRQQQYHMMQQQMQKQHHMMQQLMHQQQLSDATRIKAPTSNSLPASSVAVKFPNNTHTLAFSQSLVQSNSSSGQSHQWKNSTRTPTSQAPSPSLAAETSLMIKNLSQQQVRTPQGQTQISFGGNSKLGTAPHGQQIVINNQSAAPLVWSPPNSSVSRGSGSSSKTASTGSKPGPAVSALPSQQSEGSSNGPSQKSSPVCGRNLPSILSTCPSHLSELKY